MSLVTLFSGGNTALSVVVLSIALLASVYYYAFARSPLPKGTPSYTTEAWPFIGSMQFFTQRGSFFKRQATQSPTGNFSFHAGQKLVIGLSGDDQRKLFFDSKSLGFGEGYGPMLGAGPRVKRNNSIVGEHVQNSEFSHYFNRRLIAMLKGPLLARGLPQILTDIRGKLDELAAQKTHVTNPFESLYRIVFQITMRTVACNEIADDPVVLEEVLQHFEAIGNSSALDIMYSWLPTPFKASRTYHGAKLYMIFKKIVDARLKENRREDDAVQYLMDQGDDITKIISFVLGALFAGQINSGINAAWILVYLANHPEWLDRVRTEVNAAASRHNSDASLPLKERLMSVPFTAWETEFPMIDLCLKDSIRMQGVGTAFRRNISGAAIPLNKEGTEVIPPDAFVAYAWADLYTDPSIYKNPGQWDPSRYLPGREEDKQRPYGWTGWGVGKHPCLGMRFAKLENYIITSFCIAYFDELELLDAKGKRTTPPLVNHNEYLAARPDMDVFVRYTLRND